MDLQCRVTLAHHEAARGLAHVLVEVQAGARDGIQGAVWEAGQAGPRAEAAARQAGRWAGQAGRDGSWCYKVSHCVVEGLGAHREACWTFFHTAFLEEVVAGVALYKTEKSTESETNRCTYFISSYESENQDTCPDSRGRESTVNMAKLLMSDISVFIHP